MKVKVIIACLITVAVVGASWGLASSSANSSIAANLSIAANTLPQVNPIIDDQEGIQVIAKWERQDPRSGMQKFIIELNNHVLDLDGFDFARNIKLQVDGIEVPASIKAANTSGGGHHVSSEIAVRASELTKLKQGIRLSLIVENLGNTPDRTFSWVY